MTTHMCDVGFIGGSGTNALDFPLGLGWEIPLAEKDAVRPTPFGASPPVRVFEVEGLRVMSVRMHGWRPGVSRADASRQVFHLFQQAGVRTVVSEGGVGAIDPRMTPRDLVLPGDYLDFSLRKDVALGGGQLLIMRDPMCPVLSDAAARLLAEEIPGAPIHRGAVYACTDGSHFESRAEVRMLGALGAHVVGQSLCPEVYLAREIGACYVSLQQVVNRAEGVGEDWDHQELAEIFHRRAPELGRALLRLFAELPEERPCGCATLRKPTLLRYP